MKKPVRSLDHEINAKKKEKHIKGSEVEDLVRQWVESMLGIRLDPKASFATLFKSGVLLCDLLNKIQPGLIKKIDQSNAPFKQMDNIQNFLDGCKQLGMNPGNLFNTIDLFEEKDIMNVITTVYVLGLHAATIKGYSGAHLAKPSSRSGSMRRHWQPVKDPVKGKASADEFQPSVVPINTELVTKQQFKYDPLRERTARQWIEAVVGQGFPYPTFAHALKDGMLLCKLLNAIQPGTIQKINNDVLPFKQRENIENYIKGCAKLGLPASVLFDTNALFEEKDINAVIDNIHDLAKHAQKIGYNGPQIQSSIQSTPSFYRFEYIETSPDVQPPTDAESQALLYWANNYLKSQDLPATNLSSDFTNGVRLCVLAESVTGGGVGLYVKEPVLPWHAMQNISLALQAITSTAALYEKMVNVTGHSVLCGDKTAITDLLRVTRELDLSKDLSAIPQADRRQKVAEELVSSEKNFVAFVGTVVEALLKPLKVSLGTATPILNQQEILSVFGNLEEILKVHTAVLSTFEALLAAGPTATFGNVFIENAPSFQALYSAYIANFDGYGARVKRLRRAKPSFDALMKKFDEQREKTNHLDLSSYLITPVQRLPRCILLIQQLLECTPDTHPDFKLLGAAREKIDQVVRIVNTGKVSSDNIEKLQKIEGSIVGYQGPVISDPSRKFVREGFLRILGLEDLRSAYFFLLSDMVLYCKYKPGGKYAREFKFKAIFPLAQVLEVKSTPQLEETDGDGAKAFELITDDFSLVLFAESAQEKQNWVRDIKSCLA